MFSLSFYRTITKEWNVCVDGYTNNYDSLCHIRVHDDYKRELLGYNNNKIMKKDITWCGKDIGFLKKFYYE